MPPQMGLAKTHFLRDAKLSSLLEPESTVLHTASKVVCTLGPACRDVETLVELLNAGMTAARVDLTWGPVEYHEQSLKNLGIAMQRTKRLCATVLDTVGREIMIIRPYSLNEELWPRLEGTYTVEEGQEIRLTVADVPISLDPVLLFPVNYPSFNTMAAVGDTIFIGRYLVSGADESSLYVEVTAVEGDEVVCIAKNSAILAGLLTLVHSRRQAGPDEDLVRVDLPVNLPLLSEVDINAMKYLSSRFDIDFLSLTYTRDGADVRAARAALKQCNLLETKIIAKLEDGMALLEFDGIAAEADAIVFSRGNLGLDVAPEKMARVQKAVIAACNLLGKPVLLTRLCDTMAGTPRPTRAEATDVANAVLDGADGFLLGAETLRGKYPVVTVQTILSIAAQAEKVFDYHYHYDHLMEQSVQASLEVPAGQELGASPTGGNSTVDLTGMERSQPLKRWPGSGSFGAFGASYSNMSHMASSRSIAGMAATRDAGALSKLESIASSAVRAAEKVQAGLIVVYANRGNTARLVAKYRPPMPVVALVVPHLKQRDNKWTLQGRAAARQSLIVRGVVPMLAAPMPGASDAVLTEALRAAVQRGLVDPSQHAVCLLACKDDLVLKIVSISQLIGVSA